MWVNSLVLQFGKRHGQKAEVNADCIYTPVFSFFEEGQTYVIYCLVPENCYFVSSVPNYLGS